MSIGIAKTVFSKWSIEILVSLYLLKSLGFEELRQKLKGVSSRVLSQKLKNLETHGLVLRNVIQTRPFRVRYSLTEPGIMVATLGEPVFLYLRLKKVLYTQLATRPRELLPPIVIPRRVKGKSSEREKKT